MIAVPDMDGYERICNQPGVGLVSRVQLLHVLPYITGQTQASGCDSTRSVVSMNMETRPLPCPRAKVRGAQGPSSHNNECNTECRSRCSCWDREA